jgi:hypothetical protein
MARKSEYKRYACIGPGGWNCSCCNPAQGIYRKLFFRLWKRRERRSGAEEVKQILINEKNTE